MQTLNVAHTIKEQLGNRALYMLGAHCFVGGENCLLFGIKGTKRANKIKIELNARDLYDVTFYKVYQFSCKTVAHHENLYFDQLHQTIKNETGLYTNL